MKFPVFDLHCDTSLALLGKDMNGCDSLRKNSLHIDLERASSLGGYAQCFACFTTPGMQEYCKLPPLQVFEREMAALLYQLDKNSDRIRQVYSTQEIQQNLDSGIMSAILTIEGPAGFDFDPALLEDLYKIGFRITTLGWNEKNPLTGSHITGGGLTEKGREYVREAQRLGMLIDVSHISDEGFWDIMEITQAPVIASHSNSRALCDISRNLSDDMFRAICKTGGVVGINLYTDFLGQNASIDTVCDHIFHFMSMDAEASHIALGGDLDGCDVLPTGFDGIQDYDKLASRLLERGLPEETVKKIFWDNAMGVLEHAVRKYEES